MKNILWNETENRPRALWRMAGQLLILVAALMIFDGLTASFDPHLAETLVGVLAFIASVALAGRWLDKRPLADFGLRLGKSQWWLQLAFGLLLGALLMGGIFLFEYLSGYVAIVEVGYTVLPGASLAGAWIIPIGLYLSIAVSEEVLFRGYFLRNLAEGLAEALSLPARTVVAVLVSSVIFGLAHLGNPAATFVSTAYLVLLGVTFALGYIFTGELAIPIGLHWAWNFFQGNVFGFPVSGKPVDGGGILRIAQAGPEWLTGGAFGPEAGAVGVAAMAAGCILIVLYCRRTQNSLQLKGLEYHTSLQEKP